MTFAVVRVEETVGLNSNLPDGYHVLMWDVDNIAEEQLWNELENLRVNFQLPQIYAFKSSMTGHYHAICLRRSTWREAILAAGSLEHTDDQWLKGGVVRGYFTLRIGLKHGYEPEPQIIIPSDRDDDVALHELVNYDRYETVDH